MVSPLVLLISVVAAIQTHAWTVFVVPHTAGQDDAPALMNALAVGNISTNGTILFSKGVTYNILTPIKFPVLNNVEIRIEGNLTYSDDIVAIQGELGLHIGQTLPALADCLNDSIRYCRVLGRSSSFRMYSFCFL